MSHLYTEVRGSGPTLVLLHGWGLNVRVWDGLAAALCDRFRIVSIDLPGHGRSGWLPARSSLEEQAAQVRETIATTTEEYSLLGWSLGGQIALQLAVEQQAADARLASVASVATTLNRLVLIATTPRFVAGPDWPHGAPPERLAAQAEGLRRDYRRTVSDFLDLQVRGSAGGAEALAQLRSALFAHGLAGRADDLAAVSQGTNDSQRQISGGSAQFATVGRGGLHAIRGGAAPTVSHIPPEPQGPLLAALARGLELLRDTDLRPQLPEVIPPTLVVAGQYDRVTLPAASRALADSLPNGRYVEIRRAAHAPFLSHLPELSALISKFLPQP